MIYLPLLTARTQLDALSDLANSFSPDYTFVIPRKDKEVFYSESRASYTSYRDESGQSREEALVRACLDLAQEDPEAIFIFNSQGPEANVSPILAALAGIFLVENILAYQLSHEKNMVYLVSDASKAGFDKEVSLALDQALVLSFKPGAQVLEDQDLGQAQKVEVEKLGDLAQAFAPLKDLADSSQDFVDIKEAEVIFAGGKGLKNQDGFDLLARLAKKYHAGLGATRPCIELGYLTADHQIGQTGYTVKPRVYFAFGIQGAIQHRVGMKDSDIIVAVNTDPEAEIFKIADYGLIEDARTVIEALLED